MRRAVLAACVLLAAAAPASAQVDFSGNWAALFHEDQPERVPGPEIGDYLALPITDEARAHAEAWSPSLLTLPEHQCKPHPVAYGYRGPANMRVQQEIDPLTQRIIKITIHIQWQEQFREIWMDGRPHPPPAAAHTWQGFSTGRWDGNALVVTTTHMKPGWVRRNGVWYSDQARFTDRFVRHGDVLTHMAILEDPLTLTEPFIRTTNWMIAPTQTIEPYPCIIVDEIATHKLGDVPHFLPGTNNMLNDFARSFNLDPRWAQGGTYTHFPEFRTLSRTPAPAPAIVRPARPGELSILPVQGNVHLLTGAGSNIVLQAGPDGVLVVDSGPEAMAERVLAAIREFAAGKPIRYVINTSADADHTGANDVIGRAGSTIAGGDIRNALGDTSGDGAAIVAHEAVQQRMAASAGGASPVPFGRWPTETFFTEKKELFFNGEGIQVLHAPKAHTDGDLMIYFRKSDVLVVGDLFSTEGYPVIRADQGGTINGVIGALNRMIDISIPKEKQEGGTYIVGGHGRIVDEAEVVDYRDMITIVRDRVQDLITKGRTLEQVRAANPTFEYDKRWSGGEGSAETAPFVEAVYRTLR